MSADLHALVHSLTRAEKRHLRLHGTRRNGKEAQYLQLLDALLDLPTYDEAALQARFQGQRMLGNFAVAKAYLYEAIIEVARQLQQSSSVEATLHAAIDEVEFLLKKGLDRLAMKALEKALQLARDIDLPAYKAELLRWKRRLVNKNISKGQAELLRTLENEEVLAIEQQLLDAKLRILRAKVQALYAENVHARNPETQAQLIAIQADPLLQADDTRYCFQARQAQQNILSICHRMFGRDAQSLQCLGVALAAWQGRDDLIRIFPDQYMNLLVNYLDISLSARDFDAYQRTKPALAAFAPSAPKLQARARLLGIHLDLRYAMITGDFEPGLRAGQLAETVIKEHAKAFDPSIEATVLFNLSSLYFLHGDHSRSRQAINQILNRQSTPIRQDIADAARLLEMAIELDLGDLDRAESLQRAMHRRLRLHPRSEDFENILVRGLKRWWGAKPSEQAALLQETYQEIRDLEGASNLIGRTELLHWLRGKIDGLPPAQVIRKGRA